MLHLDCYDAIECLDDAMLASLEPGQRYYVLGGIVTGALCHESTDIEHQTRSLYAAEASAIPIKRTNGTQRDVDILIEAILDPEQAEDIKKQVIGATAGALAVSVFGFDKHEPATKFSKIKKSYVGVSRRTIDNLGVYRYELDPLEHIVSPLSYDPWKLVLPSGSELSILHPAGHMLAYGLRSISGVRAKDVEKLHTLTERVLAEPRFNEEIKTGNFRTWLEFAEAIWQLRDGKIPKSDPRIRAETTATEMALFQAKSKALRWVEGKPGIVSVAQHELGQKVLNLFVRAK